MVGARGGVWCSKNGRMFESLASVADILFGIVGRTLVSDTLDMAYDKNKKWFSVHTTK